MYQYIIHTLYIHNHTYLSINETIICRMSNFEVLIHYLVKRSKNMFFIIVFNAYTK